MARKSRNLVRRWLIKGRLRHVVAPLYRGVVAAELALERGLDRFATKPASDLEMLQSLTAVVKTFERPYALQRLLDSLRRFYPELHVVVVDDGRAPTPIPGVEHVILPYDSGVSAGRKAGLERVHTPYMLTLDDDFVFYRHTRLPAALAAIMAQPQIDILGGAVVNLPLFQIDDYTQSTLFPTAAEPVVPLGTQIGGLPVYDKVPNFFIGRTERVRLVGWDPQLKRIDHADFFTRARGVLTSVFKADFKCLHIKTPFDTAYMQKRMDYARDQRLLHKRYYGR